MLNDPVLNSRVTVRITRHIAAGLLCTLDSGRRAIIRNREISWDTPCPLDQYISQTKEALVIGYNRPNNELELSLRLVEWDPWPEAIQRYPVGAWVQGQVKGLIEAGAFVVLEPGVEGYLPADDLLDDPEQKIADWLWIGDHVQAIVTDVQHPLRRLRLSIRELLARRAAEYQRRIWRDARLARPSYTSVARTLPPDVWLRLLQLGADADRPGAELLLQVLVVEDDAVYAGGLESLFRQNRCQVTLAAGGADALRQVQDRPDPYHLIVIDWNLPGLKGHEVVRALQSLGVPSRLVLVLEWTALASRPAVWEEVQQSSIDVLFKADGEGCAEGLVSILRDLREDRERMPRTRLRHLPAVPPSASPEPALESPPDLEAVLAPQASLSAILDRLKDDTRASAVLLVHLGPGQATLRVDGCVGDCAALQRPPPDIIHSPLADVLRERRLVAERVAPTSARFRKLLAWQQFEGFLGLPVPVAQAAEYGLILLRDRGAFGKDQVRKAQLAVYVIALELEKQRFVDAVAPWQAQNLVGQVASSVVHEVTNKLSGLELEIKALQGGLRDLAQYPPLGGDPAFLHNMEQAATRLAEAQRQASELRNRYLGLTANEDARWVDLNTVAQETVDMLKPEAQQWNVVLEHDKAPDLPKVWARPGLLRQILLNLGINAIQQMAAMGRQGVIQIQTSHLPHAPLPVQVRVADEGPGVHASLWERIFDFGFSTKKDGAGLGLTICRQAAARLGGAVRVEESYMWWGSTFVLELPEGGDHG